MNLRPTRVFILFLCFTVSLFLLVLSCSKDGDLLLDAVIDNEETVLPEDKSTTVANEDEISEEQQITEIVEESSETNVDTIELESRITVFPTAEDAYLQNGNGFDDDIIRLQENLRRSYLMFDLSEIDAIGGEITAAHLEFTINTDDGNGTIKVYKGNSNDWNENDLSEISAPEISSELGEIEQEYKLGDKIKVDLNIAELNLEMSTLILDHKDGDDLAFASKENTTKVGPQLVVTYNAPVSAESITIISEQVIQENIQEEVEEDEIIEENPNQDEVADEEADTVEEGDTTEDTPEDNTPEEIVNSAPTAVAEASILSGEAPLQVSFTSNKSSDDKAITSFTWNFKDGSSSTTDNPIHTFTQAGIYEVSLTISDAEGLTSIDQITIIVNEKENEPPVARAFANIQSGNAPLIVDFTGSNSTDDSQITSYFWNFSENTSTTSDPRYTFENPGVYSVVLTVTDDQGLTHSSSLNITVTEEVINETECFTNGGLSGDEGLKQWCWSDLAQEINSAGSQSGFSNSQLAKSVHYNASGVFVQNGRLNFKLNPTNPSSSRLNFRQEIRDNPADVRHPIGTEQWWGFDYSFDDDYIADELPWIMWQTHGYDSFPTNPMTALELAPTNYLGNGNQRGELFISNSAFNTSNPKKTRTGIVPVAGQKLKIVIQLVWGDNNTGLFKVWIDDVLVYNEQERTVYVEKPEGGYWKIGIYKWRWQSQSNVNISANLGIHELHTSIGPLKVIKKSPTNPSYLTNEFNTVRPR